MRRLLILILLAASSVAQARPDAARVEVSLKSFGFVPATVTLHHGQAYVLHLANTASGGHDFVAREFFAAARVDPADRRLIHDGGVDVRVVAPAVGRYPLKCSHFMHAMFGMKGEIVVD